MDSLDLQQPTQAQVQAQQTQVQGEVQVHAQRKSSGGDENNLTTSKENRSSSQGEGEQSNTTGGKNESQENEQEDPTQGNSSIPTRVSRSASASAEFIKTNAKLVAGKVSKVVSNSRDSVSEGIKNSEAPTKIKEGIEKVSESIKHSETPTKIKEGIEKVSENASHKLKEGVEKVSESFKNSEATSRLKEGAEKVSEVVGSAPNLIKGGIVKVKEVIKGEKKGPKPVYLDNSASTPVSKQVAEAMIPYLTDYYGNAASSHFYGKKQKEAMNLARQRAADCLGCSSSEIIFTSGCTESNNLAIKGVVEYFFDKFKSELRGPPHIITSTIEHASVYETCKHLERRGLCSVTYVGCDSFGFINPQDVESAINSETVLISIMHSNNEVGTLQPIK